MSAYDHTITKGKWEYVPPEGGDPSVGMQAIPPTVVSMLDNEQEVEICQISDAKYEDRTLKMIDPFDEPYIYVGDPELNGKLIAQAPRMREILIILEPTVHEQIRRLEHMAKGYGGDPSWLKQIAQEIAALRELGHEDEAAG